jgi:hypothetical protein
MGDASGREPLGSFVRAGRGPRSAWDEQEGGLGVGTRVDGGERRKLGSLREGGACRFREPREERGVGAIA